MPHLAGTDDGPISGQIRASPRYGFAARRPERIICPDTKMVIPINALKLNEFIYLAKIAIPEDIAASLVVVPAVPANPFFGYSKLK
ncbi:hypothetical protein [uncultured Thalassospira sp.]|uniref:hypothetical protein n=1 Tax=uncultured Thalassospira sp. TaxID=404382 RepID=UPI002598CFE2|nr:hypothetical protein [uncultured Thalassospira sp.]